MSHFGLQDLEGGEKVIEAGGSSDGLEYREVPALYPKMALNV